MPPFLRHGAAVLACTLPAAAWDRLLLLARLRAPSGLRGHWSGDRIHKLAALLPIEDPDQLYRALISAIPDPCALVVDAEEPTTAFTDPARRPRLAEFTDRMMYYDAVAYLPDDILVKLDRTSMAVSLEARVPLLDHRVVEFAWQLPTAAKLRAGSNKWLLRQLFHRYLPAELAERPKQGFAIPLADWLRGPLRDWAEDLLDEHRLVADGFLHAAPVRRRWQEHLTGSRNWSSQIWGLLMFQAWRERWLATARTVPLVRRELAPAGGEQAACATAPGL
jgi:asparagine synthase (glutamine-hydrolysing)